MAAYKLLTNDSKRWYIHKNGGHTILGPLTSDQIREALRKGLVDPFDNVCREGGRQLKNLIEEEEIFEVAKPVTVAQPESWEVPPWDMPTSVSKKNRVLSFAATQEKKPETGLKKRPGADTGDKTTLLKLACREEETRSGNEVQKNPAQADSNRAPAVKSNKSLKRSPTSPEQEKNRKVLPSSQKGTKNVPGHEKQQQGMAKAGKTQPSPETQDKKQSSRDTKISTPHYYLTDKAGHKSKVCSIREICDYFHSGKHQNDCHVHRVGINGSVSLSLFMQILSGTFRKSENPNSIINHLLRMKKSKKITTDCLGVLIDTYTSDDECRTAGELAKEKLLNMSSSLILISCIAVIAAILHLLISPVP